MIDLNTTSVAMNQKKNTNRQFKITSVIFIIGINNKDQNQKPSFFNKNCVSISGGRF